MNSTHSLYARIFLFVFALIGPFQVLGSHLNGGWIHAEYDGNSNGKLRYTLTLNLVYVNSGTPPGAPVVDIESAGGTSSSTLALVGTEPYDDYYSVLVYNSTILLDANTDYVFSHDICCRRNGIVNLGGGNNSATFGIYFWSELSTGQGNSLPVMLAPPSPVWPSGVNWRSSFRHTDKDGDSLGYSFADVFEFRSWVGAVQAVPLNSGWGTTASLPGSSIDDEGMVTSSYAHAGQMVEYIVVGNEVTSYDVNSGVENGKVHYDLLYNVRDYQGVWSKPILVGDPVMTFMDRFSFRVNRADTLDFYLFNERRWGDFHYPYWADQNVDIYQDDIRDSINGVYHKVTRLSVTPNANQTGLKLPMVLRFDYGNYFNYDYHFDASVVSGIGIGETELRPLSIYPNPTKDQFWIALPEGAMEVRLFHLDGREIAEYSVESSNGEFVIPAPESSGMYVVILIAEDGVVYSELVSVE